ncbi:MAG: sigma-70 family RNA polymerase sigma factor [Sulfurovum sp.]|nr:sigma-70 family RNA polymerase sigma factor [Sulfurovum sp.]
MFLVNDFESIWTSYENELSTYVLSRVRDEEIQKEVMQEVALKIFTSLHLQKEHLRGWLYELSKNVIVDYYRKVQKPLPIFEDEIQEVGHVLAECLTPMIESLKDEEKEILTLTQIQEYSLKEVARLKNIPINTAKSKLFRAKKSLAEKFFSCCEYEHNHLGEVVDFNGDGCRC